MKTNRQQGFTIVEMIVAIGLVSLMIVVLAQLFLGGHRLYQTQNAELNINYSARRALDDIDYHVRQATQVISSYGAYSTGTDTLVLEVQSVNSSDQLIPGTFDTVIYYLSGAKVYRQTVPAAGSARAAATLLLAENVTLFRFIYDNASYALVTQVTTNITLLESTGRENQTLTVTSTSALRN